MIGEEFRDRIERKSERDKTRVVLALDLNVYMFGGDPKLLKDRRSQEKKLFFSLS